MMNVVEWTEDAVGQLENDLELEFVTQHVDQLTDKAWDSSNAVELSYLAFAGLVQANLSHADSFQASLVVPLTDRQQLDTRPIASLKLLLTQRREAEPPSLYLIRRISLARWNDWEQYRTPIDQDQEGPEISGVRAHYSCYRDAESRAHGWEFSRAIYFDHFTNDLLRGSQAPIT
jgi:hypothetical protein